MALKRKTDEEYEILRQIDYRLVQRSLHGDENAWQELYQGAYRVILRQIKAWNSENVLTSADMGEIADEALFRCYCKRESFQAISRFSTWACGFAAYVTLEYKRKRYKQLTAKRIYSYNPPVGWTDPDAYVIRKERDFCLWLAYDSLEYFQRVLIAWGILEWYTKEEARKMTGIRRSDMDTELEKARKLLKSRFNAAYNGSKKKDFQ